MNDEPGHPRDGLPLESTDPGVGHGESAPDRSPADFSVAATLSREELEELTHRRWGARISPGADPTTTLGSSATRIPIPERVRLHEQEITAGPGHDHHRFEPIDEIGRGGMGVVMVARQLSLDRLVAIKMLTDEEPGPEDRDRFIAEAVVTGELDHPNIVPIHDLGIDSAGRLFYAMKWVRGTPWNRILRDRSREENLETLLRVCDAVAFAHSRGVIHRDLKPHNVMLGDFGEVLVMDWGLAATVTDNGIAEPLTPESAAAGTAAYMAPEMAFGRISRIGISSDIYLLGAILFEIATGAPPHPGATVIECLTAAAANRIHRVDDDDELVGIALHAMSTDPGDRHDDVAELQADVRAYLAHTESRALTERAHHSLETLEDNGGYEELLRIRHAFEQALELWPGNIGAKEGAIRARRLHARKALAALDLDLAASLLDPGDPEERHLAEQVERARAARDSHRRRVRRLTGVAASLAVILALALVGGALAVRSQRDRARHAEAAAATQRNVALETLDTILFEVVAELEKRPAMYPLREDLIRRAISGLNRITAGSGEDTPVDRRLATAHRSMARIFHLARREREAIEHQRTALSILEPLAAGENPPGTTVLALANAEVEMGDIVADYRMGDLEAAQIHYRRALDLLESLPTTESGNREIDAAFARVYRSLGNSDLDLDRPEQAYRNYSFAVDRAELAAEGKTTTEVIDAVLRMGDAAVALSKWEEAERRYGRALEEADRITAEEPGDRYWPRTAAFAEYCLGDVALLREDLDRARAHLLSALERQKSLASADPADGQILRDLLVTIWRIGDLRHRQGRLGDADLRYTEATTIAERILDLNPANIEAKRDLFVCHNRSGDIALELGDIEEARHRYEFGLELSTAVAAATPNNFGARTDVVVSLYKLGSAARAAGDTDEARRRFGEALRRLKDLVAEGRLDRDSRFYGWISEIENERSALRRPSVQKR